MQNEIPVNNVLDLEDHLTKESSDTKNAEAFLANGGNLYQHWRGINWPFEEMEQGSMPVEETDLSKDEESIKNEKHSISTDQNDLGTILLDAAAISGIIEQIGADPSIKNEQINWIDQWTEDTYKDLGISKSSQTPQNEEENLLFESISPLSSKTESEILSNMHESKFVSWLKQKNTDSSTFQELKTEEDELETNSQKKVEKKEKEKKKKEISDTKLSKKKKKKELKKILKKSLEMEDEIVSETLANVMVQQGHIQKAISMYEKLSLIFPEKSAYFAQRIENLEEE